MARNGWRAEDAILAIFEFGSDKKLEPKRRQCLTLNVDGLKRCGWRCPLLTKPERCEERIKLVEMFQASHAPDAPLNFKTDVMRFIVLACCHEGPGHVIKMENEATKWFKAHSHEVPQTSLRPTRSAGVRDKSPTRTTGAGARHFSTAPTKDIEMMPYTKGRDEEQLRKAIEDDLVGREFYRGRVYITVSSDLPPGYVKIGYTTFSLDERFAFALKDCRIDIQRAYGTRVVPHAERLERIVHAELAAYRYRFVDPCLFCIDRPGKRHQEFFRTTVEYAKGVIEHWANRLEEGMYENGTLLVAQRGELRRLATPEKIKERQVSLSPEPPSSRRANVSHGLPTPPQSPSPPVRESYSEVVQPPTMRTRAAHDRKFESKAVEALPSPPSSPRAREKPLSTVEQRTSSTSTARATRKEPTNPTAALPTSRPEKSLVETTDNIRKAEVASVARPLPQTTVVERKVIAGSDDSVEMKSQRKLLERDDRGSATYGRYATYGGNAPYGGNALYGEYATYGGHAPYGGNATYAENAPSAGNKSYGGNGSFAGYTSNSQNVDSGEVPKKGILRKLFGSRKLRRKESV